MSSSNSKSYSSVPYLGNSWMFVKLKLSNWMPGCFQFFIITKKTQKAQIQILESFNLELTLLIINSVFFFWGNVHKNQVWFHTKDENQRQDSWKACIVKLSVSFLYLDSQQILLQSSNIYRMLWHMNRIEFLLLLPWKQTMN